jgi:hypothetical protein
MIKHDPSALPFDRRQQIARRLTRGETVGAAALATEFKVSEDAIRRDLRALTAEGVCKRVYGDALPLSPASSPLHVRSGEDIGQKRALARGGGVGSRTTDIVPRYRQREPPTCNRTTPGRRPYGRDQFGAGCRRANGLSRHRAGIVNLTVRGRVWAGSWDNGAVMLGFGRTSP